MFFLSLYLSLASSLWVSFSVRLHLHGGPWSLQDSIFTDLGALEKGVPVLALIGLMGHTYVCPEPITLLS